MSELAPSVDQPLVLTVAQAARRLGIGRSLMYQLLECGEIPSLSIGRCRRVRPHDLQDYVNRRVLASNDSSSGY